jgi:MATE family multidrug resistance protein
VTATILHILWCYLLVRVADLGVKGASIATGITYLILFVFLNVYASGIAEIKESWFFPNRDSIRHLGQFLKLGVPAALMFSLEWWVYEILTLMSGYISVEATAAEIILVNINGLLFMIPYGISQAATTVVGNSIGENNVKKG